MGPPLAPLGLVRIVSQAHGRVERHRVVSRLLAGNPLGDPCERDVPVWLPPGYDAEGSVRYPVLFGLAGFTGTGASFLAYDWYQGTLPERLDRLVAAGEMPPAVIVFVDGMTSLGGNQYIDSPAVGPWARHVVDELVPWAEQTFRVLPGRDHRGVFGKSSGGFGALRFVMDHADTFAAAACHSGDLYFESCYGPMLPKAVDALAAAGGLERFRATFRDAPTFPGRLFPALEVVAMAAFYSPRDAGGVDLPFDERTGERRDDVWARWLAHDPVRRVGVSAAALGSLRHLHVECGTRDEYHLHHGARIFSARLADLGIRHQHLEFDDGHRNLGYRYDQSLPGLARALLP